MSDVLKNYFEAKKALFEHVDLTPDWVECPVDDATEYVWRLEGNEVHYADTEKELKNRDGNYYIDEIYTQRFYKTHVCRGEDYTLIFCDPHVDGCKWWRVFLNKLEMK